MNRSTLDWIAIILVVIGGINWGLVGLMNMNLVDALFGTGTAASRIVYTIVGLAALYVLTVFSTRGSRAATA